MIFLDEQGEIYHPCSPKIVGDSRPVLAAAPPTPARNRFGANAPNPTLVCVGGCAANTYQKKIFGGGVVAPEPPQARDIASGLVLRYTPEG